MWSREEFRQLIAPAAVGMIHLPALPGSPAWAGDIEAVEEFALADAQALASGGMTAVMIENYHDVPFYPTAAPAETIAAMTRMIMAVRSHFPDLKVGVNVLRNDVAAAIAIATATKSHFVRVNVHVGATVTDQGPIVGAAWQTLRNVKSWALKVGLIMWPSWLTSGSNMRVRWWSVPWLKKLRICACAVWPTPSLSLVLPPALAPTPQK